MHIILVPDRLATARTITVTRRLMLAGVLGFVVVSLAVGFLLSWLGMRFNVPLASELVTTVQQANEREKDDHVRDNLSAMAVKLGEMQAQLIRLDALSEHITQLSGAKAPSDAAAGDKNREAKRPSGKDGQGGPLIAVSAPLAAGDLQREIDRLAERIRERSDSLTALESQIMEQRIKSVLLPTFVPIDADHVGSTFGRRVDPIAGVGAMHEGIDFVADPGTPVFASAGGVVVTAEFHPQYGYYIDIDHGNDFSSRYAHLSKLRVQVGQIIKRGRVIGASGNTGRSTGPHLHFEVRYKGVAQNPARFLQQGTQLALNSSPGEAPPARTAARASR